MRIGDIQLLAVPDGTFVAQPGYFGSHVSTQARPELFDRDHAAWLPIGCFLICAGDRLVLVDAGLGPDQLGTPASESYLVGGQLLTGLHAAGVAPADITDVVCSHFHADHVGWLFGLDGEPVFHRADIWFGAGEWDHFVTGPGQMRSHIRDGLLAHHTRLRPIEDDTGVAPGITAVPAPGHTPGHLCLVISSGQERALLLGDAITCPIQLDEPSWHSIGDVDPALADRTRQRLWQELEGERTLGAGAHFPELRFGRVLSGAGRRWLV
jgi:glyoxylase-like metal-dependent hydrolase (beta-lactamase superfamily II)